MIFMANRTLHKCIVGIIAIIWLTACTQKNKANAKYDLYLVRHFEKQAPVDAHSSDVSLTAVGSTNAVKLAEMMAVHDIKSIYSTHYKRTMETAQPTANTLNIDINEYDPRQLEAFAEQLKVLGQSSLIVGHSNTTGVLFGLLGCENVQLSESDYGDIFKLSFSVTEQQAPTLTSCSRFKLEPEDLVYVQAGNLNKYWQYVSDKSAFKATKNVTPKVDGWVEVGLIISVEGVVIEAEVLNSSPDQVWEQHALIAAKNMVFEMSQNAQVNQSIYTTWTFNFKAKP